MSTKRGVFKRLREKNWIRFEPTRDWRQQARLSRTIKRYKKSKHGQEKILVLTVPPQFSSDAVVNLTITKEVP